MLDVEGFILVGGASSRMGRDKSQLRLGDRTTVEWIGTAMSGLVEKTQLVGSHEASDAFPNVSDLEESWGPLGGIHAALHAAKADWCIIVACDLPFVSSDLLARLLALSSRESQTLDAVVPIQADGYPQPLCAIYRRLPCLAAADLSLANGEHSPRALLDKVATRYVDFTEISHLPKSDTFFFNLNTPENLERAQSLIQDRER